MIIKSEMRRCDRNCAYFFFLCSENAIAPTNTDTIGYQLWATYPRLAATVTLLCCSHLLTLKNMLSRLQMIPEGMTFDIGAVDGYISVPA